MYDQAGDHTARYEVTTSELGLLLEGIDLRGAKRRVSHDEVKRRATG